MGQYVSSRENVRRFHFLREIGSGGLGTTFLARMIHSDGFTRMVAVKILGERWADAQPAADRMREDTRLLSLLRHPNIIATHDVTSIDGRVAIVMEYLEAANLRTVSRHLMGAEEHYGIRAVMEVGAAAASALDAAYNRPPFAGEKPLRLIHREIRPNNLMLDQMGVIKVLDFCFARTEIDTGNVRTESLQFGSVEYMAPERLFFEPETPASDVYSLGATLYELLMLEKFGKARGRPDRHRSFVEDRLLALDARLNVEPSQSEPILALFRGMLNFEHDARPIASAVVDRCGEIARSMVEAGLRDLAEREIPEMVRINQERPRKPNPLIDTTLTEDSVRIHAYAEPELTEELTLPGQDAEALRRGALADLARSGDVEPNASTGSPARMGEADALSDWDDVPTNVKLREAPKRSPLDVPTLSNMEWTNPELIEKTEIIPRASPEGPEFAEPSEDEATLTHTVSQTIERNLSDTSTEAIDAAQLLQMASALGLDEERGQESEANDGTGGPDHLDSTSFPDMDVTTRDLGHSTQPLRRREASDESSSSIGPDDGEEVETGPANRSSFRRFLLVGYASLAVAIACLAIVVFVFRERLSAEICNRGLSMPGVECPSIVSNESDEQEAEPEESEELESNDSSTEPLRQEGDPTEATGIVVSMTESDRERSTRIELECADYEAVTGRWWASLEAETASSCMIRHEPSMRRFQLNDVVPGHYVCVLEPEFSCELAP